MIIKATDQMFIRTVAQLYFKLVRNKTTITRPMCYGY